MIANVLSIAGSDPSGGAGIQADLKAMSANGVFAMAAITALTAQNTQGVHAVHLVPASFVADQIKAVFDDIDVAAVKIGMIANGLIAQAIADTLGHCKRVAMPIVLDPVMIAKGGGNLLDPDAVTVLHDALLPLATVITPNIHEAAALLGSDIAQTRDEMAAQAKALVALGSKAVLLKGGHLDGAESPDCLAQENRIDWFESTRLSTKNTHGTGCTLSAALAAQLGHGKRLIDAVHAAKTYVSSAIANADNLKVGSGHGPTHHFATLWSS